MAITVTDLGTNSASTTPTVRTLSTGVPAGSLICVGTLENFDSTDPTTPGTVTDTAGNTYTSAASIFTGGGNFRMSIFYAWNSLALSSGNSISWASHTSNSSLISAFYATEIQASSDPLDLHPTGTSGTSPTTPSITSGTPSVAGELFVALVGNDSATATFTQDSSSAAWAVPFTSVSNADSSIVHGGNVVNAGSGSLTYNPNLTSGLVTNWASLLVTFKPNLLPSIWSQSIM